MSELKNSPLDAVRSMLNELKIPHYTINIINDSKTMKDVGHQLLNPFTTNNLIKAMEKNHSIFFTTIEKESKKIVSAGEIALYNDEPHLKTHLGYMSDYHPSTEELLPALEEIHVRVRNASIGLRPLNPTSSIEINKDAVSALFVDSYGDEFEWDIDRFVQDGNPVDNDGDDMEPKKTAMLDMTKLSTAELKILITVASYHLHK